MKYALLIYPKPGSHEALGEDEYESVNAQYWALREDSRCLGGAHLQSGQTATTVRYGGDQNLIIDGPYADTKEVLGGYYVFDTSRGTQRIIDELGALAELGFDAAIGSVANVWDVTPLEVIGSEVIPAVADF